MTVSINQNYISQFSDNLFHLLEQKGSKLKGLFSEEVAKGEKHFFDRIGNFSAVEITNRLEDTLIQDAAHSRRMASVRRYGASVSLDDLDKFKMMIDPTSDYAMKLANAHGRNFDTVLLNALIGTAATGADGSSSQAFDTSNQQIAHGSAGLTVAKFNQALRILQSNDVDLQQEEVYLIANSRAIEDLLGESQFTSFDYQAMKPLSGKDLPTFRGVKIIHSERIPDYTSGSVFRGIMCTADALKVALSKDLEIKTAERADLNFALQVSSYMMFGAVRMDEQRVVDILFQ